MIRVSPALISVATLAFVAYGGAAFAMNTSGAGHPGSPPGGPNGSAAGGPTGVLPWAGSCQFRADQANLAGPARRTFLWRCQQGGAS